MHQLEIQKCKYLIKSVKVYKIYGYGLLITFFTSIILKPLVKEYFFFIDFLIGFPIFVMILLAPLGLYYSWKSKREKESNPTKRFRYFLGHAFFSLLSILFIFLLITDLKELLDAV